MTDADNAAIEQTYATEMGQIQRPSNDPRLDLTALAKRVGIARDNLSVAKTNVENQQRMLNEARHDEARKRAHRDYWVERLTTEARQ